MKKNNLYIIALLLGVVLLFSFKKAPKKKAVALSDLFDDGDPEVYSKVGTKVFDSNGKVLFVYDTAGVGMKIAYTYPDQYYVIYNYITQNDTSSYSYGYVNITDVQKK